MAQLFSSRSGRCVPFAAGLAAVVLLISSPLALAQFTQQGPKLVGTGASGNAFQGTSVALSADGNTAVVGGSPDNSGAGAAWVFTRSGGVWTQQGNKLVGTGASDPAEQGRSVALSADGNTAIVGGNLDNLNVGAAWVFTRSGGVWTQQGNKLVGTGASGIADQGFSVALSADGNTAVVGGPVDNSNAGAAWVFTRSGGVWTQQGNKLVGTGASGPFAASQGYSVAMSADGNTALVGGRADNSFAGAAWVFTRSGGAWTQQGDKLVGAGAIGTAQQGFSVALSADGNTAMVGAFGDSSGAGAAWAFTRNGGAWTQQGDKLVGSGASGNAFQGSSVALSADGNKAVVGGRGDNSFAGAAWVFTRSGGVWTQQGNKLVGSGASGNALQGASVAPSADGNTGIVGGPGDNSDAGAAWAFVAAPVPFSAFSVKLVVSSFKPSFTLSGNFTLGATSNGINPVAEPVTIKVGSFTTTIPPGSFVMTSPGNYAFNGVVDSVALKVSVDLKSGKTYAFQATAGVNLLGTKSPTNVTLTIGNDTGTTTVRF